MWLVNKSAGLSSRRSLDLVARALGRRDLGHAGTLDPFATGLLLFLGGRATRMIPWIQEWDKEYVGVIHLGVATDTLDATGKVVESAPLPGWRDEEFEPAAALLVGLNQQVPPMYSAVHSPGGRLYQLARRGISVERRPRERFVRKFTLESISLPDVAFRVVCSSGTYVRVLAEEFGRALGVPAHLARLTRTSIGPWRLETARPDSDLAARPAAEIEAAAVGLEEILADWPRVVMTSAEAEVVGHGRLPEAGLSAGVPEARGVRLVSPEGRLVGLAGSGDRGVLRLLRVFEPGRASGLGSS